jgi:hypothetical protein
VPDIEALAAQLIYVIATTDVVPGFYADIVDTAERESPDTVSFHVNAEDGGRVKVTLTADPM